MKSSESAYPVSASRRMTRLNEEMVARPPRSEGRPSRGRPARGARCSCGSRPASPRHRRHAPGLRADPRRTDDRRDPIGAIARRSGRSNPRRTCPCTRPRACSPPRPRTSRRSRGPGLRSSVRRRGNARRRRTRSRESTDRPRSPCRQAVAPSTRRSPWSRCRGCRGSRPSRSQRRLRTRRRGRGRPG